MRGHDIGRVKVAPWAIYGVVAGLLGFLTTLAGNFVIVWLRPSDICRVGPLIIPLSMLGALAAFFVFAAAAGFATGLTSDVRTEPLLAGVLVGGLSGCALVALLLYGASIGHRVEQLSSLCPDVGSISFGSTPPPGALLSPPPGFSSGPPSFGTAPGATGLGLSLVGVGINMTVGIGLAAGIAHTAGIAGRAVRRP